MYILKVKFNKKLHFTLMKYSPIFTFTSKVSNVILNLLNCQIVAIRPLWHFFFQNAPITYFILFLNPKKKKNLDGDDLVASPADAYGNGLCASGGIGFVGGDKEEDFIDVALVDGNFIVGGRPEDQDLEVGPSPQAWRRSLPLSVLPAPSNTEHAPALTTTL